MPASGVAGIESPRKQFKQQQITGLPRCPVSCPQCPPIVKLWASIGLEAAADLRRVVRPWVPPAWLAHHSMPDVAASTEPNTSNHTRRLQPSSERPAPTRVPGRFRHVFDRLFLPLAGQIVHLISVVASRLANLGRVCLETGLGCLVVVDGAPSSLLTWQHPWPTLGGRGGTWR
jgi:hypothetical protein